MLLFFLTPWMLFKIFTSPLLPVGWWSSRPSSMRRYSYGNSIYQRRWRAKARTDIADNKSRKSAQLACAGTLGRRVAVINDCSWIDGKSPQIGCIPLCNTGTTRIRDLRSLQSNRTNHEDRTVCLLGDFTF